MIIRVTCFTYVAVLNIDSFIKT